LAVSAEGTRWVLFNASPDLRQQIAERSELHPSADGPKRGSPITAVVLTNADVDHVAGLLSLRENQRFALYGHRRVLDVLAANPIFSVLDEAVVDRRALALETPMELTDAEGAALGLQLTAFAVPGKVALWLERPGADNFGSDVGDTIGVEVSAGGGKLFYIPGCAAMTPALAGRLRGADTVLFDATLWRDEEMIAAGVGAKTGARMGHMSLSGEEGTLAAFAELGVRRKILVHLNNTNPVLLADSPERARVEAAGWQVGFDGMEIDL
jgi:pyrroloquinoline quinone biosynthesis protein B